MATAQNNRTRFRPATSGSQTITASETEGSSSSHIHIPPSGTLRLRAEAASSQEDESARRHVQWAQDVVNNEGMGKKSSKGTRWPICAFELSRCHTYSLFQFAASTINRAQSEILPATSPPPIPPQMIVIQIWMMVLLGQRMGVTTIMIMTIRIATMGTMSNLEVMPKARQR